jgi:hypothetical protein
MRSSVYRVLGGSPRERKQLGNPGVDGRIILRWVFRKWDMGAWTGSNWLRVRKGELVKAIMNLQVP